MAIADATQSLKFSGKVKMKMRYLFLLSCMAHIGLSQAEEGLSVEARSMMQRQVSDPIAAELGFSSQREADVWLNKMSGRLQKYIPDPKHRIDFLKTVHYEATRAGLDPQLVLSLIEVKSNFNKHSASPTGAQGYMQVMPFWVKSIGKPDHDLLNMRTNLRYGCTILRHYLDIENGDIYRALGRYDGNPRKLEFPNRVWAALKNHWSAAPP